MHEAGSSRDVPSPRNRLHRHVASRPTELPRRLPDAETLSPFARRGRRPRAAGYDTAIALGREPGRALVLWARRERRLLLRRDRQILTIRDAPATTLLLPHDHLDACAAEPTRRLSLDGRHDPFSRCLVCNVRLEPAGPGPGERFAAATLDGRPGINVDPSSERLYWQGGHVRRMRARLERWAGNG